MKILIWILSLLHIGLGLRNILNVVGVLSTSKYAPSTTLFFGCLFLAMGACALYLMLGRQLVRPALWLLVAPWIVALILMVIQLATGKYP